MKILKNQLLSQFTTIGIGGRVKTMFFPQNLDELIDSLSYCIKNQKHYHILAGGSNTVFDDKNFSPNDVVICLIELNKVSVSKEYTDNYIIKAQSGASLQSLVDLAKKNQLVGLTGLNRVPGTVGGAVFGNAGAYGCEIGQTVNKVRAIDLEVFEALIKNKSQTNVSSDLLQSIVELNGQDCRFGYRSSYFKSNPNYIIIEVTLALNRVEDYEQINLLYDDIARKRDAFYPEGLKSPGSVFKNLLVDKLDPKFVESLNQNWIVYDKVPVARLLENIGSLNISSGGIRMRPEHANIMINTGDGKYDDVREFISVLQSKVHERFGIDIEPEIRLIES